MRLKLAMALLLAALPASAADVVVTPGGTSYTPGPLSSTKVPVMATVPMAGAPAPTAKTVTNSSTQMLGAAARSYLSIDNASSTATIACAFGGTAALNTAGSYTIGPNQTRVWSPGTAPQTAVNCISSAASSPATFGAF
jgi:hypothetical protein